ncbi:hypothetical protein V8E36_000225 [Tilletia maclaganii]
MLHRSQWSVWATCALAFTSLAGVVGANEFNPFDDDPTSLLIRAGGKYVGAVCEQDSDCYSSNCYYADGSDVRRCHFQSPNRPCFKAANCVSMNCTAGYCGFSPINGRCDVVYDCADYSQLNKVCDANKCKVNAGFKCTSDDQCQTGHCFKGTCGRTPQWPNSVCNADSECMQGSKCEALNSCADETGKDTSCSPGWKHCTRLPLGSKCQNHGDCGEGFCRSGICTASKTGDACVSQTQCSSPSVCSPSKKCNTPANGTLYAQDTCKLDAQCYGNRCVDNLDVTDVYDVTLPYLGSLPEYKRCDYLKLGEGTCRTYVDCAQGICKDKKCVLGKPGDRCLYNDHCESLCGLDGKCFNAPASGTLAVGEPCTSSSQCFSQNCDLNDLTRPLPYKPNVTHHVVDDGCYPANAGGQCIVDSDCQNSACRKGKCIVLSTGDACTSGYQCASTDCSTLGLPANATQPVCTLVPAGGDCFDGDGDQCYSGFCDLQPCEYGGECGPTYSCRAEKTLGTCRVDRDCRSSNALCDGVDKKCRLKTAKACKTDEQCLSRSCTSGKCAAAGSTTVTTTSSSSSSSSTKSTSRPTSSTKTSSKLSSTTKITTTTASTKTSSTSAKKSATTPST